MEGMVEEAEVQPERRIAADVSEADVVFGGIRWRLEREGAERKERKRTEEDDGYN